MTSLASRRPRTMPRGVVVTFAPGTGRAPAGHESATRDAIARRLARLKDFTFEGEYDPLRRYRAPAYFVPGETLAVLTAAQAGISGEQDLYGGVVPHPYVATKTITHPLVDGNARSPVGWCAAFPERVTGVVLRGFSAFAHDDALRAGRALLAHGAIRVKLASGIAGRGQWVVTNAGDLDRTLAAIEHDELANAGAVLEENLEDVTTYSVGKVRVAGITATYYGTQQLTTGHRGAEVYGGSEITVARGGFDALLALNPPTQAREAIAQACAYDAAASACFSGFYASRRNYDVAQGRDAAGRLRSGVLEQSWRQGGASGAEIGALEAFRADPTLRAVHAQTREVYGAPPPLPPGAAVYFSGVDPRVGPLTKYAWTEPHADAR